MHNELDIVKLKNGSIVTILEVLNQDNPRYYLVEDGYECNTYTISDEDINYE